MKKIKEQSILGSLSSMVSNQISNSESPDKSEALLQAADFESDISMFKREFDESENIIRKPKIKSNMKKLVSNSKINKPIGKIYSIGKKETKEVTGSGSSGGYQQPLFTEMKKKEVIEKWSQKYKNTIDCNNPKGFSQKAHCQGKKKKQVSEEKLKGGLSDKKTLKDISKKNSSNIEILKKQLIKGIKVEMEHTDDKQKAKEIAMDHLFEDPKYYDKLKKIEGKKTETKEATGSSSSGSYVTPAAWAKSTKKKDWRGRSKTQIPGGKFVQVKEKCKKFPYCNQGDIKALKIFDSVMVKKAITEVSKKFGLSEKIIKNIVSHELLNNK